jgi:ribonuclease HI
VPAHLLEIFTDGTFDQDRCAGAWAFIAMHGDRRVHEARGAAVGTSNNTFEILAVLEAMIWIEAATSNQPVTLWTDSAHVVEGCNRYRAIWRNNGWKRIDPNPRHRRRSIPDEELWKRLDDILSRQQHVTVSWCKAHSGIAGNEHADCLARRATSP